MRPATITHKFTTPRVTEVLRPPRAAISDPHGPRIKHELTTPTIERTW